MDIPSVWGAALASIQAYAPEAFIAGGALRDLDLGRPVKDLDVFVSEANAEAVDILLKTSGFRLAHVQRLEYFGADPSVAEAREYHREGHLPVNVIALRDSYHFPAALNRFDLGLCQIGFNGREVVRTGAFVTDAQFQRMTVTRCGSCEQMDRTVARSERLSAKYPGWALHVPEEFAEFSPSEPPEITDEELAQLAASLVEL